MIRTASDERQAPEKPRPLVRIDRLGKSFHEAGQERCVLEAVGCSIAAGQFICLLGKSGSGKSTLLNLISGIDRPTEGRVYIREQGSEVELTALSEHQRTLFRRRNIGIIFQFFNLIPTLTVLENVALPVELAGRDRRCHRRAEALLHRVGLGDRLDSFPDRLSGGEQQRVAIARALIHDPVLLLADEPTGNLDEGAGDIVLKLLLTLSRDAGKTLIMATHDEDIASLADAVYFLERGQLVSHHTPAPNAARESDAEQTLRRGAHTATPQR
ncbi:MAG: ABC transporter ATP-binding protein [Caldilineaceae bacterium]|nr:ABC transporter ATP-binding protein [Caldilineaceae bacterium]